MPPLGSDDAAAKEEADAAAQRIKDAAIRAAAEEFARQSARFPAAAGAFDAARVSVESGEAAKAAKAAEADAHNKAAEVNGDLVRAVSAAAPAAAPAPAPAAR